MKPLTILFLLFSIVAFGQQPEYPDSGFTNKTEAKNLTINGLKEGKWIEYVDFQDSVLLDQNLSPNYYRLIVYKYGKPLGISRAYFISNKLKNRMIYRN